ncbi:MAG TPA: hypothetical protein VNJ09_10585 [Chthonomonadales bacterium]|nr:hypothetical protein [Chthonomonadales bacterium]
MDYIGIDIGLNICALARISGWAETALEALTVSSPWVDRDALDRTLHHFGRPEELFVGLEDRGEPSQALQRYLLERGWNCRLFNPIRNCSAGQAGEIAAALRIAKTLRYSWTEGTGGEGLTHSG